MTKKKICDKCGKPFADSAILPGQAVMDAKETCCYACWYTDRGWVSGICVVCGREKPTTDTLDGPACLDCWYKEYSSETRPAGAQSDDRSVEDLIRANQRLSIAIMLFAARMLCDSIDRHAMNPPERKRAPYNPPADLAAAAVRDADALLDALKEDNKC